MSKHDPLMKVTRLLPNLKNIMRSLEVMKVKYIEQVQEFDEKQIIQEIESISREINSMIKNCDTYFKHFFIIPNTSQEEITKKNDETIKFEKNMQEQFSQRFTNNKEYEEILPFEELINKENSIDNIIADSSKFMEFFNTLKNNLDKIIDDILNKNFKENLKVSQKTSRTSGISSNQVFHSNMSYSDPREIKNLLNK